MDQKKIGEFIAALRKEKKLTQEQLAEKLNITKNAVSKWERGISLMDLSLLKPLSEILGVSVTELLNGEKIDKDNINNKSDEIITNTINYQSKENRKKENKYIFIICILSLFAIMALNTDKIFKTQSLEYLPLIIFGTIFVFMGIINYKGNISTIHWYNRRNISNDNVKKYGKLMGFGTIIIGIGMITTGILQLLYNSEELNYILIISTIIGIIIMICSQIKYNKGIF